MTLNLNSFKKNIRWYIVPLLIAVYPIFYLYAANIDKLDLSVLGTPLLIVSGAGILLTLLLHLLTRDAVKAALMTSLFMVFFFSYGHLSQLIVNVSFLSISLDRYLIFFCIILLLRLIRIIWVQSKSLSSKLPAFLLIAGGLVIYQVVFIGLHYKSQKLPDKNSASFLTGIDSSSVIPLTGQKTPPAFTAGNKKLPDIYYIILDTYPGAEALKTEFNFDNQDFLNQMEQRGFFVGAQSSPNYMMTFMSLASSLSMGYMDHNLLSSQYDENGTVIHTIPVNLIKQNAAAAFFRQYGYQYIHFSSSWAATDHSPYADVNYQYTDLNEFNTVLLDTTILQGFLATTTRDIKRSGINATFDKLSNMPRSDSPRFIFAHMLVPHRPFIFTRDGGSAEDVEKYYSSYSPRVKRAYIEQMQYTNLRVVRMVDEILKNNADNPPIIVIQGDHGSSFGDRTSAAPGDPWAHTIQALETGSYDIYAERFLREKCTILNLYYFPGDAKKLLYPSISPVNTFRLIADAYLDANLELLPDKTYFSTYERSYDLHEVPLEILQK